MAEPIKSLELPNDPVFNKRIYTTLNRMQFAFLPQYQHERKNFFWEHDQDRDTKKQQWLYITFSQSDWFIVQSEGFWLAITRSFYHKNYELSGVTTKLNIYSPKYNFDCSVTANVQAELESFCDKTHTLVFAMVQPWKKPFGKTNGLEIEKNALPDTLMQAAWCRLSHAMAN